MPGGGARTLRALLLEALRGIDEPTMDRLGTLASWRALTALWDGGWLRCGPVSTHLAAVEVRRQLRAIAAARRDISALGDGPMGALVCVSGSVSRTEEGIFVSDGGAGRVGLDTAAGMRIVGSDEALRSGDAVTVLGFSDSRPDVGLSSPSLRRLPRQSIVRGSGVAQLFVVVG